MVLLLLLDVRLEVEVAEQRQHDEHVASQQVLSPVGEITANTQRVECVQKRYHKLNLEREPHNVALKYRFPIF